MVNTTQCLNTWLGHLTELVFKVPPVLLFRATEPKLMKPASMESTEFWSYSFLTLHKTFER